MTCGLQITHTATHGRHPTSPNPPCARDPEGNRGRTVAVLYLARTFTSGRRRTLASDEKIIATQRPSHCESPHLRCHPPRSLRRTDPYTHIKTESAVPA